MDNTTIEEIITEQIADYTNEIAILQNKINNLQKQLQLLQERNILGICELTNNLIEY